MEPILTTILSGFTGIIGGAITAVVNFKMQKLKNELEITRGNFELDKMEKQKDIMIAETEANIKIKEVQVEGELELFDSNIYKEGVVEGNKNLFGNEFIKVLFSVEGRFLKPIAIVVGVAVSFLFSMVDFLKGLMRPIITIYMIGASTWITTMAWEIMSKNNITITSSEAIDLFNRVITMILFLTVSCVTWWFFDRRTAKFLMRLDDGNLKPSGNWILDAKERIIKE